MGRGSETNRYRIVMLIIIILASLASSIILLDLFYDMLLNLNDL